MLFSTSSTNSHGRTFPQSTIKLGLLALVIVIACTSSDTNEPTSSTSKADTPLGDAGTERFTADSEHGTSLWGLFSDPTTDYGFDKLSASRPGTSPPSAIGGYPMGLITRKIRASHDKQWPPDLFLTEFTVTDAANNTDLTYATEWGKENDQSRNGWVGWQEDANKHPTHIMRSHASVGDISVDSTVFTQDGAISYLWNTNGLSDVEINFGWARNRSGEIKIRPAESKASPNIVVVSAGSLWLALAPTSPGESVAMVADETKSSVKFSFSWNNADLPQKFGITLGLSGISQDDAIERAIRGGTVEEIESRHASALKIWTDIQNGVVIPSGTPVEHENFVRFTVNHIASHSIEESDGSYYTIASNGGVNQHYWLRDAAVTAIGVSRYHPAMAANILFWLTNHPASENFIDWEWFNYDGTAGTNESSGIDASAWLALAIGRTYNNLPQDKKEEFISRTQSLRDQLTARFQSRFNRQTGHLDISPHWDHDWWDNIGFDARVNRAGIDPANFIYEMGPEVVWSAGFKLIANAYEESGDTTTADYLSDISATLESHLDDYQLPDERGLSPAIDVNNIRVDTPGMIFAWGNVVAAVFLGRRTSYDALINAQNVLRRPGLDFFTLQQPYYDHSIGQNQNHSSLFEYLASGVDARWGDGELARQAKNLYDIPWAPRDWAPYDSQLLISNGLSYLMTAAFQLEAIRFECEGAFRQESCS